MVSLFELLFAFKKGILKTVGIYTKHIKWFDVTQNSQNYTRVLSILGYGLYLFAKKSENYLFCIITCILKQLCTFRNLDF